MLTGEKVVLGADILFDCGHSLNPAVDIGQARAPFLQCKTALARTLPS